MLLRYLKKIFYNSVAELRVNANSLIAGKVNIGNNVVVGGGTIVMKDIPDNCVVVGNPAYILYQNDVRVNKPL